MDKNNMSKIKVGIVGVGNCANSLISGIEWYREYYKNNVGDAPGLVNEVIDKYKVTDIEVVAAFDVDKNKVNKDLSEAIFSKSNLAYDYKIKVPKTGIIVQKGPELDGVPEHLKTFPGNPVKVSEQKELNKEQCANVLNDSGAEILLNFLPTGSKQSALFYAEVAINIARIGYFNGMPELIVCDKTFQNSALKNNVPIVGDDCKSQLGGTAINRAMAQLLNDKGIKVSKMYQINYAGNTDFYNLIHRGQSKHKTKKESVTSLIPYEFEMDTGFTFLPVMRDRKTMHLWFEAVNFGNAPLKFEAKLEVEDSPNFAGIIVDVVRYMKIALDRNIGGVLDSVCMYYAKHPPKQIPDYISKNMLDEFVKGKRER